MCIQYSKNQVARAIISAFVQKDDFNPSEDPITVKSQFIECGKKSSLETLIIAIARKNPELTDTAIVKLVQEKLNRYVSPSTVIDRLRKNGIQSSFIRRANEMKEAVLQVITANHSLMEKTGC